MARGAKRRKKKKKYTSGARDELDRPPGYYLKAQRWMLKPGTERRRFIYEVLAGLQPPLGHMPGEEWLRMKGFVYDGKLWEGEDEQGA